MRISPFLGRSLATSILVLSSLIGSPPSARGDEVSSLVDSNTLFSLNLYAQLKNNPGNLFFSPYSISACLGMTYTGARGSTEQQMAQVLGFGTDSWQFAAVFGQLQREIRENQSQQGIEVSLANALWAQKGYRFLPAFLKTVSVQFGAKIRLADFVDNPETATAHINQWVAQETKDRIEDIVPSGAINDRTRLVLANAIYFKGVWTLPFEKTNTLSQPFYLSSTSSVDAPLMHQTTNTVYYMETNDFQAVELPYGSNQLSMVVVLPTQVQWPGGAGRPTFTRAAFVRAGADGKAASRDLSAQVHDGILLRTLRYAGRNGHAGCLRPERGFLRDGRDAAARHNPCDPQGVG